MVRHGGHARGRGHRDPPRIGDFPHGPATGVCLEGRGAVQWAVIWSWLTIGTALTLATNAADLPRPEAGAEAGPSVTVQTHGSVEPAGSDEPAGSGLHRYLRREVAPSARYLDHGVVDVTTAGGWPHLYRLGLSLGLLDHLTIGATAHWLPRQTAPGWSPTGSIAFWRGRFIEAGASYHQSLHPPPALDDDPETPSFVQRTHWVLGALTFNQAWISGGFDLGMVRAREIDRRAGNSADLDRPYVVRHRLAGGLHARFGTRRWGVTVHALWPRLEAELALDVRFGLFEMRRKGGWWPARPGERLYRRTNY